MNAARCISRVAVCLVIVSLAGAASAQVRLTPKEQLGKLLYFDTNLSSPIGQSCSACHSPAAGYADPEKNAPVSNGVIADRFGSRNAPTVAYTSFSPAFHYDAVEGAYVGGQAWDGRDPTLADRTQGPFLNPIEMNNGNKRDVVDAVRHSTYAGLFMQVYGNGAFGNTGVAFTNIGDALAAYLNSAEINRFTSKFDYVLKGKAQLTVLEQYGQWLFDNKGGCSSCHPDAIGPGGSLPLFTDFAYQNAGVPKNPANPFYTMPAIYNPDGELFIDFGLYGVIGLVTEAGKMKTPSLRNIELTAPYGHNGYFATVRDVVAYYNTRNNGWPQPEVSTNLAPELGNLGLNDVEIDAIVAFLNTLTDGYSFRSVKDPREPMLTPDARAALSMNIYPNPFNPTTRIDYTADGTSNVRIAVYDVAGRLVRTLVDETRSAGAHSTMWNGRDARGGSVASGVYFVRFEMGAQTTIRKAVLTQ